MKEVLKKIEDLYGLKLSFLEKVTKGVLTKNTILLDGKVKYFLKEYSSISEQRIKEIHLAESYFAENGIPVILPIKRKDGQTYFCVVIIFSFYFFLWTAYILKNKNTMLFLLCLWRKCLLKFTTLEW